LKYRFFKRTDYVQTINCMRHLCWYWDPSEAGQTGEFVSERFEMFA